ncbi:hypothetical protein PUNSTDRAFT_133393 [Punctularia strigosozonata HHB-11173 SS5]|uniref:uncharacterized protein n=1 Tax=Punctularia strigosozonata (strain HHB-11173) TaxID=741275 RepID=UPI00044165F8|nr:uncharacterized protein PUNSTDRAFT_133393 [Punctularia strigosozonata HHB-11173 SS5]EIN09611.1 hypothetical protein PUNSTDRAFT_133393 [Punctularia strigosozonata HHB-11173 SS5]
MSNDIFNGHYDIQQSDLYITQAATGRTAKFQFPYLQNNNDSVTVRETGVPKKIRLMNQHTDGSTEELVCRMQGILAERNLLPLINEPYGNRYNLRQSVVLTGFNSQEFERFLDTRATIYNIFKRYLPPDSIFPLSQSIIHINDATYSALHLSNAIFTKPNADGVDATTRELPISNELDPSKILQRLKGNALHLDDNSIEIFHLDHIARKIVPAPPGTVNVGDLVEAEICFYATKSRNNRYRVEFGLRTITVLNTTFQENAFIHKSKSERQSGIAPTVMAARSKRRKIDDDVDGYMLSDIPMDIAHRTSSS